MSDRTDQLTRSRETSVGAGALDDGLLDDSPTEEPDTAPADGEDGDADSRLGQYFSTRAFVVVLAVLAVSGHVGGMFIPFVGGIVGAFAGAFSVGLVSGKRRYAEVALAGLLVGVIGALAGNAPLAFAADALTQLAGIGAVLGLAVGLLGAYFGRDLRHGLTQDI